MSIVLDGKHSCLIFVASRVVGDDFSVSVAIFGFQRAIIGEEHCIFFDAGQH